MPLLSYAQNGEDVVLHRVLKDIDVGHYIDVGAHDPVVCSVTKIFYDRGWSGINVEASKVCYDRLVAERDRDLNLNVAVAARAGNVHFHEIDIGMSTLIDEAAAAALERGFKATTVEVSATTLADICRTLPFSTTHFLKIDVEGGELGVLQGADFSSFRPWIVVVEATKPNTTTRADGEWRGLLEAAEYDCVLFDGLNLFFLAREHSELRERLSAPANTFDDFITTPLRDAMAKIDEFYAGSVIQAQKYDIAVAWAERERALLVEKHEAALAWAANERTALVERHEAALAWAANERAALERRREYDLAASAREGAALAERLRIAVADALTERDAERNQVATLQALHEAELMERDNRNARELAHQNDRNTAAMDVHESHVAELKTKMAFLQSQITEAERGRTEAEALLQRLQTTVSWKIMRPIRVLGRLIGGSIGLSQVVSALKMRVGGRSKTISRGPSSEAPNTHPPVL